MALDAHLNLAIFIFLSIVISFTNGFELSNQAKFSINDQIHKRFVDSILYSDKANLKQPFNLSVASANLKRLQNGLVRKRNAECLIEMHSRLSDALFVLDAHNFSSYAQNNDQNLTMKILNELDNKCIDSESLIQLFVGRENTERDFRNLISILLVESLENKGCDLCQQPQFDCRIKKSQSWFYGLIFVSIINTSSLCGAFVIPLTKKKFYKKVLMFMIGIAVGTLAGSGFLHLIPEAFGIDVDIKYAYENGYIYKGLVMMGGVYLFFLVERIMTLFILKREIPVNESSLNLKARKSICSNHKNDTSRKNHGHSHAIDFHSIAPVAWMIICGDGLHNFIDGLGIGAAFTKSIYQGINISFAVACEEFPHELGDFAILINAGMSYSTALLMNFVSACCCYVGLVAGIMLEEFSAGTWIYALAGGMFLYISLCNMIPELNEMGDEIEKDYKREIMMKRLEERKANKQPSKNEQNSVEMTTEENGFVEFSDDIDSSSDLVKFRMKILFIQNLGVLSGFFVMLILAVFRDYIKIFTEDNC